MVQKRSRNFGVPLSAVQEFCWAMGYDPAQVLAIELDQDTALITLFSTSAEEVRGGASVTVNRPIYDDEEV